MKRIFTVLFAQLFGIFIYINLPSPVLAQGTCTCLCDTTLSGACSANGGNSCTTGYVAKCSSEYGATSDCSCIAEDDPSVKCGTDGNSACYENGKYQNCANGNPPDSDNLCHSNVIPSIGFDICRGDSSGKCASCRDSEKGVWTAIGCIPTDPKSFTTKFLSIAIGIAGGIALLLMVYGAFLVSISAGDPKKAEEGKEVITGTIAGLLFIVFSVALLKLIGVDILQIPGLK